MAFHVLNAWEEKMEVEGTTNAVLKVVTCDMFEFNLDQTELCREQTPRKCLDEILPTSFGAFRFYFCLSENVQSV